MTSSQSIVGILACLAIAVSTALVVGQGLPPLWGLPSLAVCALISFLAQTLAFIPSSIAQNEHYFDLAGGGTFILVLVFAVALSPYQSPVNLLLLAMIAVWAARLSTFLWLRVKAAGSDKRFSVMKTQPLWFYMTWSIQALWVYLASLAALTAILSPAVAWSWLHLLGFVLWLAGFTIEVVADSQKNRFRNDPENTDRFINVGLWRWSRHPNYFGEIVLWIGIAIVALPSLQGWQYGALISPVFVIILLTAISGVPLLERRGLKKWKDDQSYQEYLHNTSVLIPLPPKT